MASVRWLKSSMSAYLFPVTDLCGGVFGGIWQLDLDSCYSGWISTADLEAKAQVFGTNALVFHLRVHGTCAPSLHTEACMRVLGRHRSQKQRAPFLTPGEYNYR